eukprot:CAMPEP_0116078696 /NCGR_PEP_ID=MMETSP0327-20121206/744_1 /TAXON_ID=44447 /ORGANISM="Pseudo-nitzschia delicatissima, Strain B596" /LENGTH=1586 /DNA_ID=CAMNT_0003569267 /DNA_START=176 /DNA_END=4936 /DNA_ORIENTATION=+
MWGDERFEWQEDEDELGFYRVLGSDGADYGKEDYNEGSAIPIFYRILKYGIFTLYLILFVEFVRHTIDNAARGRPFFTSVLLMVYSELATLGIVEFGVFLWGKYGYIDKEIKAKFADVHFALFLTAIFNALQYSLTSIVSTRLSNGLWVKTEQLELDHYVEIREEYDRVQEIIDMQYTGCGKWVRNCILFVFQPGLRRRLESLRVQVRFHELRLHFLEFNNLSFSLKVSDYLKRSELAILIGLVHVSVTTWVLLIGILNVGYFIFGIIGYTASDPRYISVVIAVLFFVVVVSFIVMSLALRWKMHNIFQTVMKTKVIESFDHGEGIKNQKQLFWFGSPPLVISMIQLMNFGYAISISIVIIYWEYLNEKPGLRAEIYLVVSLGCYTIFLYVISALLPEYTLCTSLGYLTNQKELQETVAMHRLEEAERQRRKRIIENAMVTDSAILRAYPVVKSSSVTQSIDPAVFLNAATAPILKGSMHGVPSDDEDKKAPLLVSDLVKIDTNDLRSNLPEKSREILKTREERIRQRRSVRKKSVSDGVAAMRAWKPANATNSSQETREISKRNPVRRSRIRKTTSQPGIIQAWQNMTVSEQQMNDSHSLDDKDTARFGKTRIRRRSTSDPRTVQGWKESLLEEKGKTDLKGIFAMEADIPTSKTMNLDANKDLMPKWKKDRLHRLAARKEARKKTQSASAIIQSWQDHSTRESSPENDGFISDENYNSSDLRALSSDEGSDDNLQKSKVKFGRFHEDRNKYTEARVKHRSNLRTLNEIEDHVQVSQLSEFDTGAAGETKVIIDLSNAMIVDNEKDLSNDDNDTVNTDKSIGGLSDIDVIQGEEVGIVTDPKPTSRTMEVHMTLYAVLNREVRHYFMSSIYRNVSHVVGTSIVFCFVGSRVEVMLKTAEPSNGVGSPLLKISTFWLEASFLSLFIVVDFIILILFPIRKGSNARERRLSLATIIDILIVGVVLALLLFSETQRCCKEESEGTSSGSTTEDYGEVGDDYYNFDSHCNCPRWGTRTYGGLGMVEPFTSLIFLRLFRFQFARCFIKCLDHGRESGDSTKDSKSNPNSKDENKYEDHGGQIWHGRNLGHESKSGSALELWERAIADFPDIVQKHGQFSGELLQAMLGLDSTIGSSQVSVPTEFETSLTKNDEIQQTSECETIKSHIKLTQSRYAKLPARAQGIVIAGSLRKPVKPIYSKGSETTDLEPFFPSLPSTGLVDFVIDNERMDSEQNTSYSFVAPFARLVRSMRRCDRRHLPLLKGWISVDVVMTQFEIVYFEAIDAYNPNLDEKTRAHCEACRLALKATKGGKNLRLCDVALGRKVVGHLDLADVTEVHVAKDDAPISDMTLVERAAVSLDKNKDLDVEHWSNTDQETEANEKYARIIRWAFTKEERLKISTNSGTLYFRFYSDLAHFEDENEGDPPKESDAITRDITFQWAETISRICGRSQLQQNLPHFGEQNEAELRDYLESVHFHEKESENERRKNTRGLQNVGNVELLFVDTDESGLAKKKTMHRRIRSMIDLSRASLQGSVRNESAEEEIVFASEAQPQTVKSSTEFIDVTEPDQKKGFRRSLSFGKHLKSADNLV